MNDNLNFDCEASALRNKGLTDENIISALIDFKKKNPVLSSKRLPTEMYDKVNLMCRKYMDRLARFEMDYDFTVDKEAFKNVAVCCLEIVLILRSQIINNPIAPYWRVADYIIDDFLTVREVDDIAAAKEEFFARQIPLKSNVQMNIALFYCNGKTYICLIWNHMCMDGGGFKMFWSDFCRNYTEYVNNGVAPLSFSFASRRYTDIYKDMPEDKKRRARLQLSNISPRTKVRFPFSQDKCNEVVIVSRRIEKKYFDYAKKLAKDNGATVTDLLLALYIDSLAKISQFPDDAPISVACATDLRRHIRDFSDIGYTNHVAFMHCALESKGRSLLETLILVKNKTAELKADEFLGLHGLPLLNFAYKTMFYCQAEAIVRLFYNNPVLSVSNVGAIVPSAFILGKEGPFDAFVAGAAKNKPCAVMTALTINDNLSVSMCLRGNKYDRQVLEAFFSEFENSIKSL